MMMQDATAVPPPAESQAASPPVGKRTGKKKCLGFFSKEFISIEKKFWAGFAISLVPLLLTLFFGYKGAMNFFAIFSMFWLPAGTVFLCVTLSASALLSALLNGRKEKNGVIVQFIMIMFLMPYYAILAAEISGNSLFFQMQDPQRGLFHFALLIITLSLCTYSYFANNRRKENSD